MRNSVYGLFQIDHNVCLAESAHRVVDLIPSAYRAWRLKQTYWQTCEIRSWSASQDKGPADLSLAIKVTKKC